MLIQLLSIDKTPMDVLLMIISMYLYIYLFIGIEIMKVADILYPSARREFEQKSVTIFVNPALHQYISGRISAL